jgi:rfaE bifunctional protein kinase chain/domain
VILVVGDVMLDRYAIGQSRRRSPEFPSAPVVLADRVREFLGGAANVAANASAMGSRVELASVTGRCRDAELVRAMLGARGVGADLLLDSTRLTTVKTRVFCENECLVRLDREQTTPLTVRQEESLLSATESVIRSRQVSVVILSDYGKGVLTDHVCRTLIRLSVECGARVVVDPKREDFSCYVGAWMVTPNRDELEATGRGPEYLRDLTGAHVLVKRGADGMELWRRDADAPARYPALNRSPVDVSGAGDTVVAAVASFIDRCAISEEPCRHADCLGEAVAESSAAASASVRFLGTAVVGALDIAAERARAGATP